MVSKWEEKPSFNVVVEGGFWDFDNRSYDSIFKLMNLECLDNLFDESCDRALLLLDDNQKYTIQGSSRLLLSRDFREIKLESSLKFNKGVILYEDEGYITQHESHLIDQVNAVFTREGLVFLNEDMLNYHQYLDISDSLEESVYNLFKCKKFDKLYKKSLLNKK